MIARAGFSEVEMAAIALHQRHAQKILEMAQVATDDAVIDLQRRRRRADAAQSSDGFKGAHGGKGRYRPGIEPIIKPSHAGKLPPLACDVKRWC